jgi:hypothetical protein
MLEFLARRHGTGYRSQNPDQGDIDGSPLKEVAFVVPGGDDAMLAEVAEGGREPHLVPGG